MTSPLPLVRHFFVVNPVSFYRTQEMEAVVGGIHRFFKGPDNSSGNVSAEYAVHISRFPRNAISAIHRFADAVPTGVPLRVYAVGGDGILFDCLNGVIGLPNVELGIMPYGKKNNFYRVFSQENKEIFYSLEMQTKAASVPMDALYCSSNYALSHCIIGLEALTSVKLKRLLGRYPLGDRFNPDFTRILHTAQGYLTKVLDSEIFRQSYRIWVDDVDWSGLHTFIHVANSPWHANGFRAVPEAVPSDGLLDILACRSTSKTTLYGMLKKYFEGAHHKYPQQFSHRSATKVFITSSNPLIFTLDDEIFYDKYISVEIKPSIVRIINPTLTVGVEE